MQEYWITSKTGLTELLEIGARIPKNTSKKIAGYVWIDTENEVCSVGVLTYSNETEARQSTFALKSNVDYSKVARIVKFEARRK